MRDARALILTAATFAVLTLIISTFGIVERFELPLRDRLMRTGGREPASSVVVVAIDDSSLASVGAWPWSRAELAKLVDAALDAGATAVAIDILLVEPSSEDQALAYALRRNDSMLLAGVTAGGETPFPPPLLSGSAELVHGVLELDGDGVLRRLASTKQTESASYTAMSVASAARIRRGLAIPVGRELIPAFSVRPDDVPQISAVDLLSGRDADTVANRVVFIGVTATGLGDRVITPVTAEGRLDPGAVVHATIAEAVINDDLVSVAPPWIVALLAAVIVSATWLTARLGGLPHVAGVASVIVLTLLLGAGTFVAFDLALPIVLLTATATAGVLVVEARALLSVEEGVGRATRALGAEPSRQGSPTERLHRLEEVADAIAQERRLASESHRVVAHELRTPLTSIRGLAQLLAAYDLSDDERRRVATMVAEESTRLHEMVEGLLDLERLALRERGSGVQPFDGVQTLAKRAELARAVGTHEIALECEESLPLNGDPSLVERILENLVGNAMKFSPPGSTVTLRAAIRDGEVVIEVEDEGPGIPPDERERVLRRFGRGRRSAEQPGLGLGLAFVVEIAHWHDGRVEVDEGARGGACLRVRLPAAAGYASKESIA